MLLDLLTFISRCRLCGSDFRLFSAAALRFLLPAPQLSTLDSDGRSTLPQPHRFILRRSRTQPWLIQTKAQTDVTQSVFPAKRRGELRPATKGCRTGTSGTLVFPNNFPTLGLGQRPLDRLLDALLGSCLANRSRISTSQQPNNLFFL